MGRYGGIDGDKRKQFLIIAGVGGAALMGLAALGLTTKNVPGSNNKNLSNPKIPYTTSSGFKDSAMQYDTVTPAIGPTTDNALDLGTLALEWRKLFLSGPANIKLQTDAVGLTIQGASGGVADLHDWKDQTGMIRHLIDKSAFLNSSPVDFVAANSSLSFDSNAVSNTGTGSPGTVTISITNGHETIVVIALQGTSVTVTSVTDTDNTPYVLRAAQNNAGNCRVEIWSGRSTVTDAAAVITVNMSGSTNWTIQADSILGAVRVGNTNGNSANSHTAQINLTTQDNNNWIVAGYAQASNQPFVASADNIRVQAQFGTTVRGVLVDKAIASSGATSIAVLIDSGLTVRQWAGVAVEYRVSVADQTPLAAHDALIKFVDLNSNGQWDTGETVIYDADNSGTYSVGDTVISGTTPTLGQSLTIDTELVFYDFFNTGIWTTPDPVIWSKILNGKANLVVPLATLGRLTVDENLSVKGTLTVNANTQIFGQVNITPNPGGGGGLNLGGTIPSGGRDFNDGIIHKIIANASEIDGLEFEPQLVNDSANNVTLSLMECIFIDVGPSNTGSGSLTITDLRGFDSGGTTIQSGGALTITNWRSYVATGPSILTGAPVITNYYGLDVMAGPAFAINRFGIVQRGAVDLNLFVAPMRHGDLINPTRLVEINGGVALAIKTVTTTYTALLTDHYILGDATTASFAITLPSSASAGANSVALRISIKKKDATVNTVTITAGVGDTIQGAATVVLSAQYSERTLYTDGSGTWYVESTI